VLLCVICVFVCCLIVVPLPPGENPFAAQLNNNSNNNKIGGRVDPRKIPRFLNP
jgi:hypothetical protein